MISCIWRHMNLILKYLNWIHDNKIIIHLNSTSWINYFGFLFIFNNEFILKIQNSEMWSMNSSYAFRCLNLYIFNDWIQKHKNTMNSCTWWIQIPMYSNSHFRIHIHTNSKLIQNSETQIYSESYGYDNFIRESSIYAAWTFHVYILLTRIQIHVNLWMNLWWIRISLPVNSESFKLIIGVPDANFCQSLAQWCQWRRQYDRDPGRIQDYRLGNWSFVTVRRWLGTPWPMASQSTSDTEWHSESVAVSRLQVISESLALRAQDAAARPRNTQRASGTEARAQELEFYICVDCITPVTWA